MNNFSIDEVHESWRPLFLSHVDEISALIASLASIDIAPARRDIFRAFQSPLDAVRVVIFGQDPYPGAGVADGLAFSSRDGIPPSLRNIFKEYMEDLSLPEPSSGDLTPWSKEGVLLLNRTLTTAVSERNAHLSLGWLKITESIAQLLGEREVVAILWGQYAQEFSRYFEGAIESPHPSPLSAYRGFFGSKPFSRANEALLARGKSQINWRLP